MIQQREAGEGERRLGKQVRLKLKSGDCENIHWLVVELKDCQTHTWHTCFCSSHIMLTYSHVLEMCSEHRLHVYSNKAYQALHSDSLSFDCLTMTSQRADCMVGLVSHH